MSLIFVTVSLVRSYYKQKIAAIKNGMWRTQHRELVGGSGLNDWGRNVEDLPLMQNAVVREPRGRWGGGCWRG